MNRQKPNNQRHFADLAAIAAGLVAFGRSRAGQVAGFDLHQAITTAEKRVRKFYGSATKPPQGEREKLRRRIGGFARLHDHSTGNCPRCAYPYER